MSCKDCSDIKNQAPSIEATGGITKTVCKNVQSMNGIEDGSYAGQIDTKNFDDMNKFNNCYVKGLSSSVNAYSDCEWKKWAKKAVAVMLNMFKLIICWLQGLWCYVKFMANGFSYQLDETNFHVTPNAGIQIVKDDEGRYPKVIFQGHSYRITGTVLIKGSVFDELGLDVFGQQYSGKHNHVEPTGYGYTLCWITIDRSQVPQLSNIYSCVGNFTDNGCANIFFSAFAEGEKMPKQWGDALGDTVPKGQYWIRIAVRDVLTWGYDFDSEGHHRHTFNGTGMCGYDLGKIKC